MAAWGTLPYARRDRLAEVARVRVFVRQRHATGVETSDYALQGVTVTQMSLSISRIWGIWRHFALVPLSPHPQRTGPHTLSVRLSGSGKSQAQEREEQVRRARVNSKEKLI